MFHTLENELFRRVFEVSASGVRSVSMVDKRSGLEYLHTPAREFMFSIDGKMYSSYRSCSVRVVDGNTEVNADTPEFIRCEAAENQLSLVFALGRVELSLNYRIFPGVCGYRKSVSIINKSGKTVKIDKFAFDDTCAAPGKIADCALFSGYSDTPQPLCFTCEGNEDMVRCHDRVLDAGWFMGSTAPGILRYMMIYPNWRNALNALNMSSAPFAKFLENGESFTSPESVFALYSGKMADAATADDFNALLRVDLPPLCRREGLMYCTWIPFLKNINASLVKELISRAAALNYRYFVLDDGWFTADDHAVDKEKFPGGLEEISDAVRAAGMESGLWLNIGTAYGRKDLPENFFARQYDGKKSRLGFDYSNSGDVLCLGSLWRDAALAELEALAEKYHPAYFKLDFSSIMSPYGLLPYGCHAKDHAYHRCWHDSFMAMYDGMHCIKERMLERFPEIILDFSFETFGTEKPNIAALELSALHHVTNIAADDPDIQDISMARKSFYPWLKRLPAERILNGLLAVQGERCAEALLTSFAGAPLTAGDLRSLTGEQCARLKKFSAAFNSAVSQGALTKFRSFEFSDKVDGFCRLNENGSGFAAFFNRTSAPFNVELPDGVSVVNVENGDSAAVLPANDCVMFFWQ